MTVRLTLLAAAPTGPAVRAVRFGDDRPPGEHEREQILTIAARLSGARHHFTAPSARCRETARLLGLPAAVEPDLRDGDMGSWTGRTLDDIAARDPASLGAWTADPDAAPHGGESVSELCARVARWLDGLPDGTGRAVSVAGPAVVRAAVVHALGAGPGSFPRVDVLPLAVVRFTRRAGRWNLRLV
ncbi:histidine phosphatase family protein [Streptomyces meridianus]|uniref:Histidine phosphatase family protein n=1 Tax=Streptomyces meridianus TaxID=2938945 RepID=A0ABT0X0Z3_9ACTN|nr:histidine phosphatase family protein [Streptomyces meridianus]MCM2576234.1 histidine phosphatase family protein [Streptomyces meridianus]